MPQARISDRSLISVSGPEAEHFLQNLVTTDIDALQPGEAKAGALLSPQGKILFDFLVARAGENGFRLECRTDIADDLVRRLTLYKLRSKVEISRQDPPVVLVSWSDGSSPDGETAAGADMLRDTRFAGAPVFRTYGAAAGGDDGIDAWQAFRISQGVAESGADYALGNAFPHDVLLDETGGVGFRKGCYVGQEVVSRMQHRGTARRRVMIASAETPLPPTGTDILAGGRSIGSLGSVSGSQALAIVRIDRVRDAQGTGQQIVAGGVALTLSIPAWAKYRLPEVAAGAGET